MEVYYADINRAIGYNCYDEKKPFYMLDDFIVIIQKNKSRIYLKIPKDFKSDGCTIWKPFRILLGCPHSPKYLPASIIHDYIVDNPDVIRYDRKTASDIFLNVLLKEGVCPVQAVIMYCAVELWQSLKNIFIERWV